MKLDLVCVGRKNILVYKDGKLGLTDRTGEERKVVEPIWGDHKVTEAHCWQESS